ncbi:MAG: hypothetical protein ACRD1T_04880, partial [Acidimicrobiia bacterium]
PNYRARSDLERWSLKYLSKFRHLASAIVVIAGGAIAALFLALDLVGIEQIAFQGLQADSRWVAIVAMLGTAIFAAGKLAEANWRIEDLTGEERTYKDAPIIGWTDPRVQSYEDGSIGVLVQCENVGPSESVATFRQFDCWTDRPDDRLQAVGKFDPWHPIKSHKLGEAHKFAITMRSRPGVPLGKRAISWVMVYADRAHPEVGYLTQASLRADFQAAGSHLVEPIEGSVFLDASSTPKTRRKRYLDHVAEQERAAGTA